ncbi:MAG: GNAT family N-acetyltransferase [Akkermansiaceae bacterium]
MRYSIEEASEFSDDLHQAVSQLLPQLVGFPKTIEASELRDIIKGPHTLLLVAKQEDSFVIVGMLTLVIYRIPTGTRAWIEDVVVSQAARGQGVGMALTDYAKQKAGDLGADMIDLTSNPARESANRLYQRAGFNIRETNVYRLNISQ